MTRFPIEGPIQENRSTIIVETNHREHANTRSHDELPRTKRTNFTQNRVRSRERTERATKFSFLSKNTTVKKKNVSKILFRSKNSEIECSFIEEKKTVVKATKRNKIYGRIRASGRDTRNEQKRKKTGFSFSRAQPYRTRGSFANAECGRARAVSRRAAGY